jgi:hypothetical protein
MQQRWETILNRAVEEAPKVKRQADAAPSIAEQAQQANARVQGSTAPRTF